MRLQLIEPVPVEDEFITGISPVIEDLGFGGRIVYYVTQTCVETGQPMHIVKRRFIMPKQGMIEGHPVVRAFLYGTPRSGRPGKLRLVR